MTLKYTDITTWQESEADLRAIRHQVFVIEQSCPPEEEWDAFDQEATHFLVKDAEGNVYATARLIIDRENPKQARIGRFAVYAQYRGQGLARQLVKYVIAYARSQGFLDLTLSAQTYIRKLYTEFGFEPVGEEYEEVGIPHIKMHIQLAQGKIKTPLQLVDDDTVHRFNSRTGYMDHLIPLLDQAKHSLLILTQDLEKGTLDHPKALDAISALARKSRSTFVKILLQDPKPAVESSNRLLKLVRRLTTSIEIKMLNPEVEFPAQVFVLVDDRGIILRHHHESWEGFCCYNDPGTVKRMADDFHQLMVHGQIAQELRQFSL